VRRTVSSQCRLFATSQFPFLGLLIFPSEEFFPAGIKALPFAAMALIQFLLFTVGGIWLVFLAAGSGALECYICDTVNNTDGCKDPFTLRPEALKDCDDWCRQTQGGNFILPFQGDNGSKCPTAFTSCRKIKQSTTSSVFNNNTAVDRIYRTCGYLGEDGTENGTIKDYAYRSTETSKSEIFSCTSKGCNAANLVQVSGVVAAISAVLLGYVAV